MAIFLLDTDMLSLHQRNQSRVIAAVDSHATDQLCVSTVTLEEQIGGWSALARSAKTPQAGEHAAMLLASLVVSWNRFAITPMTVSAWTQFESLVSAKLNVKHNDLRIAAIAKEIGATVVTRNRRDFGACLDSKSRIGRRDACTAIRSATTARPGRARESVHPVVGRRNEFQSPLPHLRRSRQSHDRFPDFRCQAVPSGDQIP